MTFQERWDAKFSQLMRFKQITGHCNVATTMEGMLRLAHWVGWQRELWKVGRLSPQRAQRLSELGFLWDFSSLWGTKFQELARFRMIFGHCNVPRRWNQGRHLGSWVSWLRQRRKVGPEIPQEKVELLNSLGFEWELWDPARTKRLAMGADAVRRRKMETPKSPSSRGQAPNKLLRTFTFPKGSDTKRLR